MTEFITLTALVTLVVIPLMFILYWTFETLIAPTREGKSLEAMAYYRDEAEREGRRR